MEAIIKSLSVDACNDLDEAYEENWRHEREEIYEDGVKVYDVSINLDYVTIATDEDGDGVWLSRACDNTVHIFPTEFLAIVIR